MLEYIFSYTSQLPEKVLFLTMSEGNKTSVEEMIEK
jgi:hypothetical protein